MTRIYLLEGRATEQKHGAIEKVTDASCEAVDTPRQNIRVLIIDVPKDSWDIGEINAQNLGR